MIQILPSIIVDSYNVYIRRIHMETETEFSSLTPNYLCTLIYRVYGMYNHEKRQITEFENERPFTAHPESQQRIYASLFALSYVITVLRNSFPANY